MISTNNKKIYFELMRIIAVMLVIFNHLPGYTLYQTSSGYIQWFYMVLSMVTRINVPLFLMISGAVLLPKNEDFSKVIKKRVFRFFFLILISEGALFCAYKYNASLLGNDYIFTFRRFIGGVFANNLDGTGSYWYLYSYLGMLFTLPFMQRIARNFRKDDFGVLIGLHFIFSSAIPMINILLISARLEPLVITGDFSVPFATSKVFFYPLVGYYLENYVDVTRLKRREIGGILFAAFAGIYLSCACTYWQGITTSTYTQDYVQLFDYLTAIAAFVVIKYTFNRLPGLLEGRLGRGICYIGSLTFGIYILDPFFKLFLYSKYEYRAGQLFPTLFVSVGWVILSMFMGGATTIILKKIPGIKKLI